MWRDNCVSFLAAFNKSTHACITNNMASNSTENVFITPPPKQKQRRPWPVHLSEKLCRDVFFLRPYQFPPRSNERKDTWSVIYDNLWTLPELKSQGYELKAVKDHLDGLIKKRIAEVKKEGGLTGLGEAVEKAINYSFIHSLPPFLSLSHCHLCLTQQPVETIEQ